MASAGSPVMSVSPRTKVLIIGDRPVDKEPFARRRLTIDQIKIEELNDLELVNESCCVLLSSPSGKLGLITSYFEDHFLNMCAMGLVSAFFVSDRRDHVQVGAIRDEAYRIHDVGSGMEDRDERKNWIESLPWVFLGEEEWKIAEVVARHDPGPRLGIAEIVPDGLSEALEPSVERMLRRAFHDASRITIKPLAGGRTAKEAFCVHANLGPQKGPNYGPQPMPFFVKVGEPWKIEDEKRQYRDTAEPFIPFHLRPSLIESRCVRTLKSAVLACNFVESAAPLRSALQSGQGNGLLFSLFEVTLRGLRMHTLNSSPKPGVLESFLNRRVKVAEIATNHPGRIKFLQSQGEHRKPEEIFQTLNKHASNVETREGHYHGDLHYGNIMARNGDAIVIDFGSMGPFGPVSADPAILEVSLVFGTDKHESLHDLDAWRELVDDLYKEPLHPPQPKGYHPTLAWLHRAIRELRHVIACCRITDEESLIILAGCMLRYARHKPLPLQNKELDEIAEARRAYALMTAYRLCDRLATQDAAN